MKDMIAASPIDIAPYRQAPARAEADVDMHAIFKTVRDRKWLILAGTAACFLASLLYVTFATPEYQATAMIQVEGNTPRVPGQSPDSPSIEAPRSQAVTEIPLLTSRSVLANAVDNLSLEIKATPQRFPLVGGLIARRYESQNSGAVAPAPLGLDRFGWGGERISIRRLDVPAELEDVGLLLEADAAGQYTLRSGKGDALVRGQAGRPASANGITILVDQLQANPGMRFDVVRRSTLSAVNALAGNLEASERGRESGIVSVSYTNPDPALAEQVLSHITSAYLQRNIKGMSAEAETSLKFVNEQLPKVRTELDKAQAELNAFQTKVGTVDIDMQTNALLNQIVAINASIQQLRTQQPEIARRFTPAHPAYQALQKQIGGLEGEKSRIQGRISQLPDIQQGLFRLSRDVDVTNQTYTNLLNQAQQLRIARASAIGNVRLIDQPSVDTATPVWPLKLPIVLGATVLGGLLMLAYVLVRQMLDRRVDDPSDVEELGLPVFASILLSDRERALALPSQRRRSQRSMQPSLLALSAPADVAMEAVRGLRTSLHFARNEPSDNLLMITGPSSGVGKTFVASNLAVATAQTGQRVMLIDADMRRGTLHDVIGTRSDDGLSDLLAGSIALDGAVRRVAGIENLSFIPRGGVPTNPSELLMRPSFPALLRMLAPRYDLIIIDTPPVLAVTDATVIGNHVGITLLVVGFGINEQREVALAKQRLEQNGVRVDGAIVNGVHRRAANGAYAYGYGAGPNAALGGQ